MTFEKRPLLIEKTHSIIPDFRTAQLLQSYNGPELSRPVPNNIPADCSGAIIPTTTYSPRYAVKRAIDRYPSALWDSWLNQDILVPVDTTSSGK